PNGIFQFSPALKTVSIDHPEMVTYIGECAFYACPSLSGFSCLALPRRFPEQGARWLAMACRGCRFWQVRSVQASFTGKIAAACRIWHWRPQFFGSIFKR
ncbi:MAG: hypothetical protein IKT16_00390, partial [Desulfovibrio sp.]|nr:hypothetical protein [Desulfovibrio sp.]